MPSPTQLPRGLRWLEGVSSLFKSATDAPPTGSLLAPILDNPRPEYGATRTVGQASHGGPAQLSLEGMANSLFPVELQGLAPKGRDNPPSSHSSLPHDAIQAEVARQLEGVMLRARRAEQENQLLRAQLTAAVQGYG